MARHSGETIMRYVQEAPLKSLRTDMGFVDLELTAVFHAPVSRVPRHLTRRLECLEGMLAKLVAAVHQHTDEITVAQRALDAIAVARVLVQNTTSAAVHMTRRNNASQTICGWTFGVACKKSRIRRATDNHCYVESFDGTPDN